MRLSQRQMAVVLHVESRRPPLDPAQQQMLDRVETDAGVQINLPPQAPDANVSVIALRTL